MKRKWKRNVGLIIILFVFQMNSTAFAANSPSNNELIIKYKNEDEPDLSVKEKKKLEITTEQSENGRELVEVQQGNTEEVIEKLEAKDQVEYVVENSIYRIADETTSLVDPFRSLQWNLKAINAPQVWGEIERLYNKKVKVAVIDTGVKRAHEDLYGRVGAGQTFLNKNNNGITGLAEDDHGHGTFIAGIIAANTNNQKGIASVTGNASIEILPVKVMDSTGLGETYYIAEGIDYAVKKGANIINLSISGSTNKYIEDAIIEATKRGVLVVAAAGNGGKNANLYYPGALKQVISVGSTTIENKVYFGSNKGSTIDLVAPGVDVLSTSVEQGNLSNTSYYKTGTGTSYATPHVTAIAAMYKVKYPDATAKEIRIALEKTATDIADKGKDVFAGNGLVNAKAALAFKPIRTIPKITSVSVNNSSTKVLIRTEKLATVQFKISGKTYKGVANNSGLATIKITKPVAGLSWQAIATNLGENSSKRSGKVADQIAPKIQTVTAANNSTKVTVKTEKGAKISLKINGKTYNKTANSSGIAVFKVSKPSAGKTWLVSATDSSNNKATLSGKVKDRVAPKIVKVSTKVKSSTTKISGTAEKNATVIVYRNSKKYKTVKATAAGRFKVAIAKQKKKTILTFYAKDKSGNQSKRLKLIVK